MNYYIRSCFILLLSTSTLTFAEPVVDSNDYWQCTTHDAASQQWTAKNIYKKVALNYSYYACKKNSQVPSTCKTTSGNCEQFIQGISMKPMWSCTALDSTAAAWFGELYSDREDAALGAKAYCQQKSAVPETCYINLITCVNKNI